jgi:hypothetical protein
MSKTLSFTNAANTVTVIINQAPDGDKSYEIKTTNYADVPVNVANIPIPDFDEDLLLALHSINGAGTKKPTNTFPEVIRQWVFKWFPETKTATLQHLVNTPKQWHNNPGWILIGESASDCRTFHFWMSSTNPNTVPDVSHLTLEIPAWIVDLTHFKAFYKGIEYVKETRDGEVTTFDKDKNFLFQWRVPRAGDILETFFDINGKDPVKVADVPREIMEYLGHPTAVKWVSVSTGHLSWIVTTNEWNVVATVPMRRAMRSPIDFSTMPWTGEQVTWMRKHVCPIIDRVEITVRRTRVNTTCSRAY